MAGAGREIDLDRIPAFVQATSRSGRLMGEPGMGKTTLLGAAGSLAWELGISVVSITGVEYKARLGYSVLHRLPGAACEERPSIVPDSLLAVVVGGDGDPAPERAAVARATLSLVPELSGSTPTLPLVDDLQWMALPA
ncbi:ATP-binding protein [Nonomuraea sp. NPDC052116]|uniref:ATP-binding protein n=1 Tax=Nonomuraea sp. NPDC052116 TaxID=3155665 RepID=UPI003437E9D4